MKSCVRNRSSTAQIAFPGIGVREQLPLPLSTPSAPRGVRTSLRPELATASTLTRADWERVRRTLPDGRVMSRLEHRLRALLGLWR
jgi:hypothetical protein